jgi:DNA-directed RNA polymerase specialized sigma24 family protein
MRRFCFSTLTNSNPAEVAGGWFPPATMRPHQSFSGVLLTESFRHLDREVALEILRTAAGNSPRDKHLLKHFRVQGTISQAEAAKELGISEENFRQRFHHFRASFHLRLRQEVSKLAGPNPKDIDDERRYLVSVFARCNP